MIDLLTPIFITIISWLIFISSAQQPDPCSPSVHTILDDVRRSPQYQATNSRDLVCDRSLATGWYRFQINGQPAEIPTKCAPVNHCGTQAPLWLNLGNGKIPPSGQEAQFLACTTWSFPGRDNADCCIFRYSVKVKNCDDFLVYHLPPTQGCHMAYCAAEVDENNSCDSGDPACRIKVQTISSLVGSPVIRPVITPQREVQLNCSFQVKEEPNSKDTVFRISWHRILSRSGTHFQVRTLPRTSKYFDLLPLSGNVNMGEKIFCEVEAYHNKTSFLRNLPVKSDPYFLGIKIEPSSLVINESGSSHSIAFTTTLPLVCPEYLVSEKCHLTIRFRTRVDYPAGHQTDIVLSQCEVHFDHNTCKDDGCKTVMLEVQAIQDFITDNQTATVIETEVVTEGDVNWFGYSLPDIPVLVEDIPSKRCYSITEPHFITFDERRYDFYKTGTFVLYKSIRRTFEVHGRIWLCGGTFSQVSCNCGFAAREADDLVIVDMCNGNVLETKPEIQLQTLGGGKPLAKIHESRQGKIITVVFPSGSFIRAYIESWGMSIILQAPSADFSYTRGLCGTFDGNPQNDFHDTDGNKLNVEAVNGQIDDFVEIWRLEAGESLFDKVPTSLDVAPGSIFCSCSDGDETADNPYDSADSFGSNLNFDLSQQTLRNQFSPSTALCNSAFQACWRKCALNHNVNMKFLLNSIDITDNILRNGGSYTLEINGKSEEVPNNLDANIINNKLYLPNDESMNLTSLNDSVVPLTTIPIDIQDVDKVFRRIDKEDSSNRSFENNENKQPESNLDLPIRKGSRHKHRHSKQNNETGINITDSKVTVTPVFNESSINVTQSTRNTERNNTRRRNPGRRRKQQQNRGPQVQIHHHQKKRDASDLESSVWDFSDHQFGMLTMTMIGNRYFFPGDMYSLDQSPIVSQWPTPNGLTESEIQQLCAEVLLNSTLFHSCKEYLLDVAYAMEICVLDVTLMDDPSWAFYTLALIESQCEEAVIQQQVSWPQDDDAQPVTPQHIIDALNCPNKCSGHGLCLPHGCVCNPGFASFDCSISEDQPPEILKLNNDGLCDIQNDKNCERVKLIGKNFHQSNGLLCQITAAQYKDGLWLTYGTTTEKNAIFYSPHSVECTLPITNENTVTEKTFAIKVSNDKLLFSNPVFMTVYNSSCQECQSQNKQGLLRCSVKEKKCIIDGYCYSSEDINGENQCLICHPKSSKTSWTTIPDNNPPVIDIPKTSLYAFDGEDFSYHLTASDPEDHRISFSLKKPNFKATLTKNGIFHWKAFISSSLPIHIFNIEASDECNTSAIFQLEVEVQPCKCHNEAQCVSDLSAPTGSGRYICSCPEGFSGHACEDDIDECLSSPCLHGRCRNYLGNFSCECDKEFIGRFCEIRRNECESQPCYKGVSCINLNTGFKCGPCPEGTSGNGIICKDINDCLSNPCFPGVQCFDLPAPRRGFKCDSCPKYYIGNGTHCDLKDNNACSLHDPCFKGVECRITPEGLTCGSCPDGYTGNGFQCSAICKWPCPKNQYCASPNLCKCQPGYSGSRCLTPICQPSCKSRGVCIGPDVCICRPGRKGKFCELDDCDPPCENGGHCIGPGTCYCKHGFVGAQCQTAVCRLSCRNGGKCVAPNRCECDTGWSGVTCEMPICDPVCRNGGMCIRPGICSCPANIFGSHCQHSVCHPPCRNGGHCMRLNTCQCPKGWTGKYCQTPICEPRCLNGGKCWKPNKCDCPSGWKGKKCHKAICVDKCHNGGTCVSPNICACPPGYRGANCKEPICVDKCMYGGKCIVPNKCQCRIGFSGPTCSERTTRLLQSQAARLSLRKKYGYYIY